jgi:adenylate cyclase
MAEERVQRRLAAILAADVVGYSRLMEADEEGTLARMKSLRNDVIDPKIAEYSGRIFKTTGDGFLAEFPSAVDAVRHAIDVQRDMARLYANVPADNRIVFRIGISLGDVMVDGDDLFGNGVNVAARMEGLAEPGTICVSGNVQEHVGKSLDITLEDLGERTVKNIDRPVRCYRVHLETGDTPGVLEQGPDGAPPLPDKPSIAVLPFDNISGDPEQKYFADGITEDLITELSRFRTLFVIARNSSFAFRGKDVDVKEVGKKLGVEYVVEGSVRKSANRVRITAQLIEATTGNHLWADRYDRGMEDIFAVQDEITETIVAILPGRLEDAGRERAQRKRTANLTAYDFVLLGVERYRRLTNEGNAEARDMFRKAIERDSQYARAHASLAWTHLSDAYRDLWSAETVSEALNSIETALSLDDDDSWYHAILCLILFALGRDEEAEIHFKRGTALNPNDAETAAVMAPFLVYTGRCEEGLESIARAKRLNPFPPRLYHFYHGLALYSAHDYEQAISTFKAIRVISRRGHAYLAACYAQLNMSDEARLEMADFLDASREEFHESGNDPMTATLEQVSEWADRYRIPSDREHFLDGLSKAGLPE